MKPGERTERAGLLSATEAAQALGLSRMRFNVLLNQGRVQGAFRIGNAWAVPAPPVILPLPERTATA